MSRSARRDFATMISVAVVLAAILWLWSMTPKVDAGRPPAPTCWWDGLTLYATDLPDEWSLTSQPSPTGVVPAPSEYVGAFDAPFTAYFWTRGGPYEAVFKPGKQLNDYKPVCVAVP